MAAVLAMVAQADVLIEGYRPGVSERLGVGPRVCATVNPRLVYGRMAGWGQTGPWRRLPVTTSLYRATGSLGAIGHAGDAPSPPVNLVGDFSGGSTLLVIGVLAARLERTRSGQGQVIDAAIVDGALTALLHGTLAASRWSELRGENPLDTGGP
ncbi:hypothetical protein A5695_06540 [Mycobacterium sp. E1747]|nr:hypothetical protein A5695_06540 [Mycobacterium sp. E1747]